MQTSTAPEAQAINNVDSGSLQDAFVQDSNGDWKQALWRWWKEENPMFYEVSYCARNTQSKSPNHARANAYTRQYQSSEHGFNCMFSRVAWMWVSQTCFSMWGGNTKRLLWPPIKLGPRHRRRTSWTTEEHGSPSVCRQQANRMYCFVVSDWKRYNVTGTRRESFLPTVRGHCAGFFFGLRLD